MYKKGEPILHPQHGAGILTDIQTCLVNGVERRYYYIRLINESGLLMIPVDQADESGLRSARGDQEAIVDELSADPEELASDFQARHTDINAKVRSGDPRLVAQALRDLAWREQTEKLSMKDERLKAEARTLLTGIFALEPEVDVHSAAQHLDTILKQAIQQRLVPGA